MANFNDDFNFFMNFYFKNPDLVKMLQNNPQAAKDMYQLSNVPAAVGTPMAKYKDNENYTNRNAVFKNLYEADSHKAAELAGKHTDNNYEGLKTGLLDLYGMPSVDNLNRVIGVLNMFGKSIEPVSYANENGGSRQGSGAQMGANNKNGSTLDILRR